MDTQLSCYNIHACCGTHCDLFGVNPDEPCWGMSMLLKKFMTRKVNLINGSIVARDMKTLMMAVYTNKSKG